GGWADLDQQLGEILQSRGMSVLGWDALNYFWKHRKAEEVAQDLDKAIRTYSELWNLPRVVLIGFSFGADVMPSAYNRLPPETQEK
ncbi:AcvB/VirJ family lysyl-phosphatidylglycerol hydrolase, partial [Pseudomonas aeruginosa]